MIPIYPVLLAGGNGTRLWPLSHEDEPKQLLRLVGGDTLLQQAVMRVAAAQRFEPLTIIAGVRHEGAIKQQLKAVDAPPINLVLEPVGRNTAAAAAIAALRVARLDPKGIVLLLSADHHITNLRVFLSEIDVAIGAVQHEYIALFGMKAASPATNYGYVRIGEPLPALPRTHRVASFVEKPDAQTAHRYLENGDYLWNSGIFMFQSNVLLTEMKLHAPQILNHSRKALERSFGGSDHLYLDAESFGRCPAISFDYAIMESTDRAAVIEADFGWTDVGSWTALSGISACDDAGNTLIGNVIAEDTRHSYIRSDGPLVATIGVEDLIVVVANNEVLVTKKNSDQAVKRILERLKAKSAVAMPGSS